MGALSTNQIERIINLPKLKNLRILSLGRNNIKRIVGLDEIGQTLEQLWLSYNQIEKLEGLNPCIKLHTFFLGNNRVRSWDEAAKSTGRRTHRRSLRECPISSPSTPRLSVPPLE